MKIRAFYAQSICVLLLLVAMIPASSLPVLSQSERGIDFDVPVQQQYADWPPAELIHRNYWYPWAWRTFQRAALFEKPVFLFIDSRWNLNAHRARQDLIGEEAIQERLNLGYLTIYVNGDERPDIVERYQTGTMPIMSLLLPTGNPMITNNTPTGEGMPITIGSVDQERMLFLLEQGNIYFDQWSNFLTHVGQEWAGMVEPEDPISAEPDIEASDSMARWISANWDRADGGFGLAPKFVIPGLIDYAQMRRARYLPATAELTANYMPSLLAGPLHDKAHGGIHRMAAGPDWTGIQYEKLLDRNATFLHQVTSAFRQDRSDLHRSAAVGAGSFIQTVLADTSGGFFLGQTADFDSEDGGGYWTDPDRSDAAPNVDQLILSAPNAQAGAALVRAGIVLDSPDMVDAGRKALDRVLKEGYRVSRGVRHALAPSLIENAFLETQADVAYYFLDAYQTTGDRRYFDASVNILEFCVNNFRLPGETRFRDHIPEPNPVGLLNSRRMPFRANIQLVRTMIRLGHLGAGDRYFLEAEDILVEYAGSVPMFRVHGVVAGLAIEELLAQPIRVTLHGDPASDAVQALRRSVVNAPLNWVLVQEAPGKADGATPEPRAEVEIGDRRQVTSAPGELLEILTGLADIGPKVEKR